jgi:septal ring factor EnvC (AmiA/AmiB activator)
MKSLIIAIALLAGTAPAMANSDIRDASINQREYQLAQRIEQGWRSGELTRREYARLRFELRDIERNEQYFMADGRLSRSEWNQLQTRLDNLSREIYRQKHDLEQRGGYYNGDYQAYRRY